MALVSVLPLGLTIASAFYWLWALACALAFGVRRHRPSAFCPPVTVLKPLCGGDRNLYENLRSFCEQEYPTYQVIFGVRDPDDPAIPVVNRLIREFPDRDLTLLVSDRLIGTNLKVSNLSNLYRRAKYDTLVLADSDIRVGTDYLKAVVGPLQDSGVGIVTCLYKGVATDGVWATLGAMFINGWFVPSALVAARLVSLRYAFGATIACRRDTLDAIGGLERLADFLADDYMLGWLTARQGFRVVLSPYVVETVVRERQFKTLFSHELRWARTFRTARPRGYFLSVVTHGLPLSVLSLVVSRGSGAAMLMLAGHLVLRLIGHLLLHRILRLPSRWAVVWLMPAREALSFALWVASFLGRSVEWNGHCYTVDAAGRLRPAGTPGTRTHGSAVGTRPSRVFDDDRLVRTD